MKNCAVLFLLVACATLTAQEYERSPFSIFAAYSEIVGDLDQYSNPTTVGLQYRFDTGERFNLNLEVEANYGSKVNSYFGRQKLDHYAFNVVPEIQFGKRFSFMIGGGLGHLETRFDSATVMNALAGFTCDLGSFVKLFVRQDYYVELTSGDGQAGFTNESLSAGLSKAGLYFNF